MKINNIISNNTQEIIELTDKNVWAVLKNTLYPGAKDESVVMVIQYCKASNLDPMQKPVHIVPMSVKNNVTNKYEYRDVVMPGIGLYRTQAARSNAYAGVSEPEFGDDVTEKIGGVEITYPKWCRVTVRRIVGGVVAEFSAKELWKENYATAAKDSLAPNAMWKKRPYGQLAKCAEAQALRKAFPELISSQPTAEEMEGKTFMENDAKFKDITPENKVISLESKLDELLTESSIGTLKEELIKKLMNLVTNKKIDDGFEKMCSKLGISSVLEMTEEQLLKSIEWAEKHQEEN